MIKPDKKSKTLKILWWNVNRRLINIAKVASPITDYKPDIFFALETSVSYDILPEINGFLKFADKNLLQLNHGGIAMYITKTISSHIFELRIEECFISFRLDFIPSILFIGTYIQP